MKLLSISTQVSDIYIFSTSILSTRTSSFINSRYYYKFDPFQKLSPFPNIINIFNNMFNTFLISNPVHDKKTKKQKNAKVSTIKSQQFRNHLQFPIKKKGRKGEKKKKKGRSSKFSLPLLQVVARCSWGTNRSQCFPSDWKYIKVRDNKRRDRGDVNLSESPRRGRNRFLRKGRRARFSKWRAWSDDIGCKRVYCNPRGGIGNLDDVEYNCGRRALKIKVPFIFWWNLQICWEYIFNCLRWIQNFDK